MQKLLTSPPPEVDGTVLGWKSIAADCAVSAFTDWWGCCEPGPVTPRQELDAPCWDCTEAGSAWPPWTLKK